MGEPLVFITRISMTVVLVVMTSVNVTKKNYRPKIREQKYNLSVTGPLVLPFGNPRNR